MITFRQKGDFKNTIGFFKKSLTNFDTGMLNKYGTEGVAALSSATPVDTGQTAASWYYEVTNNKGAITISWHNSHVVNDVPIAVILQYGHATRQGGYVRGQDYINPAIKPIFEKIASSAWEEVSRV